MLFLIVRPSAGQREFKKELAALQSVHSWKMNLQTSSRSGRYIMSRNEEAICPDQQHIAESSTEGVAEYTRVGDDVYYRQNSLNWIKGVPGPDLFIALPTPQPCISDPTQPKSAPNAGTEELRLTIQNNIDHGTIEEGEEKKVNGITCRMWKVTELTATGMLGSYSTCIGEIDHLPRTIESANHAFTLTYEWNMPLTIEAPDTTQPVTPYGVRQ